MAAEDWIAFDFDPYEDDYEAISTECPRCRAPMVKRHNRTTGEAFYGCSTYPKCRGTRTEEEYRMADEGAR